MSFSAGNLVSNSVYTAKDTMTLDQIQLFLEQKGSVLAVIQSSYLGEGANGRSAAQIIYDASRASVSGFGGSNRPSNPFSVSLNPQVILTTLQKETSLITGNYTIGSATLNNVLRIAMGYACPDGGGCDPQYEGFANQVYYGSAQLWLNYWRANNGTPASTQYPVGSSQTNHNNPVYNPYCPSGGSISFTVANAATSALYYYTPHVCNGNANFWYFMNTWFPTKVNEFTRDARLIKGNTTDQVYVWWEAANKKWYVPNMGVIQAWGIYKNLEVLSQSAVNAIPNGAGQFSRLVKPMSSNDVFFMQDGFKRYVRSFNSLGDYGVTSGELTAMEDAVMDQYRESLSLGSLVAAVGNPNVYIATAGRRHYVSSWYTLTNWGFTGADIRWIEPVLFEGWSESGRIEWLVKPEYSPSVYLVSRGQRFYVPSMTTLQHWNLANESIRTVGNDSLEMLGNAGTFSRVARGSGSQVYVVQDGKKRYVSSFARLRAAGFSESDIIQVSDFLLDRLPAGSNL